MIKYVILKWAIFMLIILLKILNAGLLIVFLHWNIAAITQVKDLNNSSIIGHLKKAGIILQLCLQASKL